jgi:putative ABC transport system ATP-binding protein
MSAANDTPLLRVHAMRFRWAKAGADFLVIDHFSLERGETVFLRGPSGCGKSTLLSLVAGVITAHQGTVSLLGQDWQQLSLAARDRLRADHVGYIFQQFNLLPYLSVLNNVLLGCRFSKRRMGQAGDVQQTARRLLDRVGIGAAQCGKPAAELSVGQQQRVAAARALMGQPDLVIADEPTSALDDERRESFMQVLMQACTDAGSALLFVSHDARLAPRFQRQVNLSLLNQATTQASAQ